MTNPLKFRFYRYLMVHLFIQYILNFKFKEKKNLMKAITRIISLLLILTFALGAAACAGNGEKEKQTTAEDTTDAGETTERPYLDSLPDDLKFDGATIRVADRGHWYLDKDASTLLDEASYRKNLSVQERLDIKIEVGVQKVINEQDQVYQNVKRMMIANEDWYDIVNGYGTLTAPLAVEGYMVNMAALDEFDLISLDSPWWSDDYIEALNLDQYVYWLNGFASEDAVHQVFAVYVNLMLAEDLIPDDNIYSIVKRGDWTLDKMKEIVANSYRDDGDGVVGEGDTFGIACEDRYVDMLAVCALADFTTRDSDNIPIGNINTERNINIGEKLYDLMHLSGYKQGSCNFQNDEFLFWVDNLDMAVTLGNMKSDFGIITMPKFNEEQEFYHNTGHAGIHVEGIPTTASSDKYEIIFAFLECVAAETYRIYRPTYLDIALKDRYSRDEGTREMLDILHDHIYTDFALVYSENTGMINIFSSTLWQKRDMAQIFAAKARPFAKVINKIVNEFDKAA